MKRKLTQQLPAFVLLGIALALFIGLFVVFAYVVFWGMLIGLILWLGVAVSSYFQKPKAHRKGQIIDYDEYKS